MIEQHRGEFPVALMCRVLRVSCSGYYAYRNRPPEPKSTATKAVLKIHAQEHGIPGSRKIAKALRENDALPQLCRNTVAKIMSQAGIAGSGTKKFKVVTTQSDPAHRVEPNMLDQDFNADAPNRKWAGDITYIWTSEGWLYLAVILDLHSRRVVG